jgi:transcriptional regulator with XRE-family HTH domain
MERDELVMIVSRNITAVMARKGTNAAEVARRAGMNPTAVYDILSGKSRSPKLDTLHKIATKGLGVPVSALLEEMPDEELDQELIEAIGMLPKEDRLRFLAMARVWADDPKSA